MEGKLGLGAARVGPDKSVVEERIGSLNLGKDPRGIGKVAGI